jgi:phage tail-like protein
VVAFELGTIQPAWDGPRAAVVESTDTLRIVLDPLVPFASEARVEVRVEAATRGGAHTLEATYTFTAEDRTSPRLLAAQAIAPKLVRLGFDEPVRVLDPLGFTFQRMTFPAVPIAPVGASAEDTAVLVQLDTAMTPDALYEVRAAGLADLAGNAIVPFHEPVLFTGFRPPRPERRRFDLWSMLPKYNRRGDTTGDLRRFIACLQEVTDLLLAEVDRFGDTFDLERAPEPFVDLILRDLGNPFAFELDLRAKRRLAGMLVEMYRQKGTAAGIRNAVRFFLGVHVTAIVPFAAETMVLGESELGIDFVLGPSERFARYAFDVHVDRVLSEAERRQLRAIVEYLRPAHTHFVDLVEPLPPAVSDHWLLGVSELGQTTDLH